VSAFRTHLENELKGTTGRRNLSVYLDSVNLSPGDIYPEELKANIRAARILIVLVSPGWLVSKWCGDEYNLFVQSMQNDPKKTVVPILWYDVKGLNIEPDKQQLLNEISNKYEWADWRTLKYATWDQEALNRAAGDLAERLKRYFPEPLTTDP
jgi:TIR domain